MNFKKFLAELQRRNVYRVAVAYGVVSWLLVQIATQVFPIFEIPNWAARLVVLVLTLGFPIAVVLAWAYELTPEGLRPSESIPVAQSVTRSTGRKLDFMIIAILLAIIGVFGLQRCRITDPVAAPRTAPIQKGVAVLPFENLSNDSANAYFAGGIQDDLLVNLSKIADLKVISRTSVRQYKDDRRDIREIGRALGVTTVLEGSVRRVGDRVRVTVQLINATNDEHIWAEVYDRDVTDILAIQSDLALQIAAILQAKLSPADKARIEQPPTKNGEAYLIYLQARDESARSQAPQELEKIAQLYMKAIQLDPTFALAFARLSDVVCTSYQATGNVASLEKARAAANEAIRLQPDLPEAHLALGYLYYRGDRDYDRALRELAIAKIGLPNDPDVFLVIGSIERRQGKWAQSTADLEKSASVNPKDPFLWTNLAINHQALRNFAAAAEAFEHGTESDRGFFMSRYLRARLDIVWKGDTVLVEQLLAETPESPDPQGKARFARFQLKRLQRKYDEAINILEGSPIDPLSGWSATEVFPKQFLLADTYRLANDQTRARVCFERTQQILEGTGPRDRLDASWHAILGKTYAGLGRREEAIREGKQAVELLPESIDAFDGPAMTLALAQIYVMVGDLDSAIPLLEHSLSTPGGITVPLLKLDPTWDPLRVDSRFQKMVTSFGSKKAES